MAYSRNWDESDPPGTTAASDIDREIREVKTDLRERLEDVINDWTDDGVDPKTLKFSALDTKPQNIITFVLTSIGSSSTVYIGGGENSTTESEVSFPVPANITVTRLETAVTAVDATESITATLHRNAAATALSVSAPGFDTGSVDVDTGDDIALEVTTSSGYPTTALKASILYEFR